MTVQVRNSEMVNLLSADFQKRYEPQFALAQVMSHMAALPGLRGFWPMSSFDENGDAFDMSEQDRTLTYNGNPTYNYDDLAPYIDLDGTGDYLSRADEAGLDILGTESYVANPGLTLGGWFWFDDTGANRTIMSKWTGAGNQRAFIIQRLNTNVVRIIITNDGSTTTNVAHTDTISGSTWYFVAARFTPSTELAIFVNEVKVTNTTSIPASIFNSSAAFEISGHEAGTIDLIDGRASLCFLCASALSDAIIGNLFQQSRALFGV